VSREALRHIVAGWIAHPDPERILTVLASHPGRYSLATMYVVGAESIPEELVGPLRQLCEQEPLLNLVVDTLWDEALNPHGPRPEAFAALTDQVLQRPDAAEFQELLAGDMVDALLEDGDEPPTVAHDFHRAIGMLASMLPSRQFACVLDLCALGETDPTRAASLMRECWARVDGLAPGVVVEIAADICVTVDEELEGDLLRAVVDHAIPLLDELPDPTSDELVALHGTRAVLLGQTDEDAAIDYLDRTLLRHPQLAASPLGAEWFYRSVDRVSQLSRTHAAAQLAPWAELLVARRDRWPVDDGARAGAIVALVMAQVQLGLKDPDRALEWVGSRDDMIEDPDLRAALAVSRAMAVFMSGRTGELAQVLRECAPLVRACEDDYWRAMWASMVDSYAQGTNDPELSELAVRVVGDAIQNATTGMLAQPAFSDGLELSRELAGLRRVVLAGAGSETNRARLLDLAGRSDVDVGDRFHASFLAAHASFLLGDSATGVQALEQAEELLAQADAAAVPQFALGGAQLFLLVMRTVSAVNAGRPLNEVIAELRQARDESAQAGRPHVAYVLTRATMSVLEAMGKQSAVLDEAILALGYHTTRAAVLPDARERATLRADFHALAQQTVSLALALGRSKMVAELLEVLRAQPVPVARTDVPVAEQSLLNLVTALEYGADPPLDGFVMWPGAQASAEMPAEPRLVPTEILLAGLPGIRMPWGPALGDRLRDHEARAEVALWVPRDPWDPPSRPRH